jgi:anthranilate synthase/aminodeoxychorismate synthase-like glutamine amidotransferase
MIVVIDNYDSFVYNIIQYLGELDKECVVFRNDKITLEEIEKLSPSHIIISPGPGTPDEAGISKQVIAKFAGKYPILGVCLGHQSIGEVFGAKVVRAPYLMHGKTSQIIFEEGESLFKELPNPFTATRYHSLIIENESIKDSKLKVTAKTSDGIIMAVRHNEFKNLVGVQFHPEAILTEHGHKLLTNFLSLN